MFNYHCHPNVAILAQVFMHSPFLGISRCQASDALLSISGGSWLQSLCTMVLYKPILHVLEGWGETKIGGLPNWRNPLKTPYKNCQLSCTSQALKRWFFDWTTPIWGNKPQSGETSESKHQDFRPFAEALPQSGETGQPQLLARAEES